MSLLKIKEKKLGFPIPPFTVDLSAPYKSIPSKAYKEGKKWLYVAKSGYENDSSEEEDSEEENKDKLPTSSYAKEGVPKDKDKDTSLSVREKLVKLYLECDKKQITRNGKFIKCNYLEELVIKEDWSYFIVKIYPTEIYLYFKNPCRITYVYHSKIQEEPDLFDSIDNAEIPSYLLSQILSCQDWTLMYDYHCFLRILKYPLKKEENAQPIFSDFVLLKPTTEMMLHLVKNSASDDTYNNNGSCGNKLKVYESNICAEIAGPLYLDANAVALEFMDILKIYLSPFGYISLKKALAKRPRLNISQSSRIDPNKENLLKILEERLPPPLNFTKEKVVQLNGSAFSYVDLKEDLHSKLANRNLEIRDDYYTSQITALIEVFELKSFEEPFTINGSKSDLESIKNISVFWRNGQFYSCLTLDKYTYDHEDSCDPIKLMGGREELDRYILKVAEIFSCRFTRLLSIRYKNMIHNTDVEFFPPLIDTKLMYQRDVNSFKESHINGTKKNDSDASDEEENMDWVHTISDNESNFLTVQDIDAEKDFTVKDSSRNWITDLFNDTGTDVFKTTSEFQEDFEICGDFTPVFETASCRKRESTSPDPGLDILEYLALQSKFEFSKEDFLSDTNQDHSDEEVKQMLRLIPGYDD